MKLKCMNYRIILWTQNGNLLPKAVRRQLSSEVENLALTTFEFNEWPYYWDEVGGEIFRANLA